MESGAEARPSVGRLFLNCAEGRRSSKHKKGNYVRRIVVEDFFAAVFRDGVGAADRIEVGPSDARRLGRDIVLQYRSDAVRPRIALGHFEGFPGEEVDCDPVVPSHQVPDVPYPPHHDEVAPPSRTFQISAFIVKSGGRKAGAHR